MFIVFEGMVEILTVMDNGTEFVIERLTQGSVINPTAFLIEDEVDTTFRAANTVTLYKLNVEKFIIETVKYPEFAFRTALVINNQLADRENAIALDYIIGNHILYKKGAPMTTEESERGRRALLALKNAIFFFILKNREERKVPKLRDVLNQAIERQKRAKEAMRKKINSITLDTLDTTDMYLTEDQFIQLKENVGKIHEQMAQFKFAMSMLNMKFDTLFMSPKDKKINELRKKMQKEVILQEQKSTTSLHPHT